MPSTLTWLAHSESERRRTQEVLRLLEEPGTQDSIGIGRIRDAISDLLFPGTSTLHTRARYLLLIPWIYRDIERKAPVADAAGKARWREIRLIGALKRQSELGVHELVDGEPQDTDGIIGVSAGENLVQLPSVAYWQALGAWGIRRYPANRSAYHRLLGREAPGKGPLDDDGEPLPGASGPAWDRELPDPPANLFQRATLALSAHEASYLHERLGTSQPESAFAQLLAGADRIDDASFIWDLDPESASLLSPANQVLCVHARKFSLIANSAARLYNLMVAEEARFDERVEEHRHALDVVMAETGDRSAELRQWLANLDEFWDVVRLANPGLPSTRERAFIETWGTLALDLGPGVITNVAARDLIRERERQLKKRFARLGNPTALAAWGGSSGAGRLAFRWSIAKRMLGDIRDGEARPLSAETDA